MAGLPKLARLPEVPHLTNLVITRLKLMALPQVDTRGIYQPGSAGISAVLDARMETCAVVPVPASCIYVDPNAARRYGLGDLLSKGPFPVDRDSLKALTQNFAMRRIPEGEDVANSVMLQSSLYAQSERNLGDGRGGYIVRTNPDGTTSTLFIKGVGQTPCCDPVNAADGHVNGFVGSHTAQTESVWPLVFQNLFSLATPGTIAFFGIDHFGVLDKRFPEEQAVILLRGGQLLRPAHFVEQALYSRYGQAYEDMKTAHPEALASLPMLLLSQPVSAEGLVGTMSTDPFFRAAHATGVLRYHTVPGMGEVPDLQATFKVIIDQFAKTGAESWRWRWMQSAPSAGNAELSGGLIDVETGSSNPRTGQMYVLDYTFPFGRAEITWRAVGVKMLWDSLSLNLTPEQRQLYNMGDMDFAQLHANSFITHLGEQYLQATGLKDGVVQGLMAHSADDVARLRDVLHVLATMENEGPIPKVMSRTGILLEDAERIVTSRSVVDVFGFLGKWPRIYFAAKAVGRKPSLDEAVLALDPIWSETPQLRSLQEANVWQLAHDLVTVYDRLMQSAAAEGVGHYDSLQAMWGDVASRAAFSNQPMSELYYWKLRGDILDDLVTLNPATGHTVLADRDFLWPTIHRKVEHSVRNTDALLRDRGVAVWGDGNVDVGVTMYGNTTYGVHADPVSGARHLFVQIPVGETTGPYELNLMGEGISLSTIEGAKLLFKMTENGAVVAEGVREAQQSVVGGYQYLGFEIPLSASQYGVFEGTLEIPGVPSQHLFEYAYVSPDNATVRELANRPTK